jgi:hypothetical protein
VLTKRAHKSRAFYESAKFEAVASNVCLFHTWT